MSGLRIPVGLRNSHPSTCLQRTLCFLCPDGRFLFPWLTAGFQGIHDFVSPSPPTGGGRVCAGRGYGSLAHPWFPELLPAFVSQVSLGCSCVWGLERPSCIGVLLLAWVVFPSRPGGRCAFKAKANVSWSAGATFWG